MNKVLLVILVMVILAPFPALAVNITTFGDGNTEAVAELDAPDCSDTILVKVPAVCHIRKATMNVSALIPDAGDPVSPEGVQVFLNDTLLWESNGTDYGALGYQTAFMNGTTCWTSSFGQEGGANNTTLRVPKTATVRNATVEVNATGRGPLEFFMNLTSGSIVSDAGDVNGDGAVDLITGFRDIGNNHAYIFHGGPDMDDSADVVFTGEDGSDRFGSAVAGAGDVNGDGYDDVIVGAYGNDAGGTDAGRAYIYFGGPNMDATADVVLTGTAAGDYFGLSVSGAGDVNRDGYDDVIAGAPRNDTGGSDAGQACLFLGGASMDGSADVVCTGAARGFNLGISVSGAGDMDGDGYDDVIAGTSSSGAHRAYIYLGSASMDDFADVILDETTSSFGSKVSGAGDVNGDGYDDVLVGAPYAGGTGIDRGKAYLYLGGSEIDTVPDVQYFGETDRDELGDAVSGAGDVNKDGYDDVVLGVRFHPSGGSVYIHLGSAIPDNIPDAVFNGTPSSGLGFTVTGAGDLDCDGYDDVAAGMFGPQVLSIFSSNNGIRDPRISFGTVDAFGPQGYFNGTDTTRDFGPELGEFLKISTYSGVDAYKNGYVDIPVKVSSKTAGNITLHKLRIVYSYEASVTDFRDLLEEYIAARSSDKDASGNLTVPFVVRSATPGKLKLVDLEIAADEPPMQILAIPDFDMDQGSLRWDLVDLHAYFEDDYTSTGVLKYSIHSATKDPMIDISVVGNRYVSVDASYDETWSGALEVVVACTDSQNQTVLSNPFNIYVGEVPHPGVNWPPSFTTRWPSNGYIGQEYLYDSNATDPDNDTLRFGLEDGPEGMAVDETTGCLTWVPLVKGSFDVSLFVTDGCSTVFQNFTIVVPNRPPRVTDTAVQYAYVDEPFRFSIPAVDDDGDELTFALQSSSDWSMTVGRLNGTVDWTPGATGSLTADFVISDGSESITWRLFITVLPGNRAPKFQTAPVTTAFAGVPYVYNANATDADRDAVTYALVRGPDGMALDNSTGSLSWVPVAPGNCLVVLSASDGNGSEVFQEFTIIVSERVGPKVQITDPARNQTIKGRVSVTGKAFPGTLEVVKVQVRVDGGDWNDAEGDTGWTYSLDTTKLKNGKHVIEARAYDGMDHSDVASRAVTVDNAKSGGTGFIPGFGTVPLLVAAAALLVLRRKM